MRIINYKKLSEEEFDRKLMLYDNKGNEESKYFNKDKKDIDNYFDRLSISEKMHPQMKMDDLVDCMFIICEFYDDTIKDYAKIEKKNEIKNNLQGNK